MPGSDGTVAHYNYLAFPRALGGIKISEDTSTLLSPVAIGEFVKPYMRRALEIAGGGYVHYCGRNDALMDAVLDEPLAHGLNLGNPDKHDMAQVLRRCAERGKLYIGNIPRSEDESLAGFMRRMAESSCRDGVCCLLLPLYAPQSEAEEYKRAWDDAFSAACGEGGQEV
jgi:hypothetical protein